VSSLDIDTGSYDAAAVAAAVSIFTGAGAVGSSAPRLAGQHRLMIKPGRPRAQAMLDSTPGTKPVN